MPKMMSNPRANRPQMITSVRMYWDTYPVHEVRPIGIFQRPAPLASQFGKNEFGFLPTSFLPEQPLGPDEQNYNH